MSDQPKGSQVGFVLQALATLGTALLPFILSAVLNPAPLLSMAEKLAIELPVPVAFYFKMTGSWRLILTLLGFALFAALILVNQLAPPGLHPLAKRGIGFLTIILCLVLTVPQLQVVYGFKTMVRRLENQDSGADSKNVRKLFEDVSKSVQESLSKSYRPVPGKPGLFYFVYQGPGAPKATGAFPWKSPSCFLLPTGPESTRPDEELYFIYPRDPKLSFAPDKINKDLLKTLNFDLLTDFKASQSDPMGRYPWVRQVFKAENHSETGLSYALQIKRARVAYGKNEVGPKTPFRNQLFEVQIMIFKDFDPKLTVDGSGLIPDSNVQKSSFVMIVRAP